MTACEFSSYVRKHVHSYMRMSHCEAASDYECACVHVISCIIFQPPARLAVSLSHPDGFWTNRQLGVPNQAAHFICLPIFEAVLQQQGDKSTRTVLKMIRICFWFCQCDKQSRTTKSKLPGEDKPLLQPKLNIRVWAKVRSCFHLDFTNCWNLEENPAPGLATMTRKLTQPKSGYCYWFIATYISGHLLLSFDSELQSKTVKIYCIVSHRNTHTHAFVPTCVSSCTTLYCSFQTAIFVASSFLTALSFFSSGLQNVLIEFIEELNLDSLASSYKKPTLNILNLINV